MRILKSHPLLKMVNSYIIDSPQPSNLSYLWNFGSLLALCLIIQIITGVTLGMHYTPNVLEAFDSVEHIMRDVNNGWLIRYLHSNTASAFFFIVYLHIGRGLYYGSYKAPRTLVWTIGTVIFILMIATAFLGYVLPYGQMSLWGATVITNLMSAIPWVGQDIVEFIWGGFSVNNATLNRFFALHFVLPFVLAALALMHLIALHDSSGSGNPLGVSGNYDRLPFAPYFIFKDLITIFIFIVVLSVFVFFMPNVLGDSENYVMANPMQTPPAIVPEWYLLPFYAILRSIPNKLLGVIAMFSAILALLAMPFTDLSKLRGIQFRPLSKIAFFVFVANFLILMQLGAKHVESPFIEFGQISTVLYFSHFVLVVPFISLLENSLMDLATSGNKKIKISVTIKQSKKILIKHPNKCRSFSTKAVLLGSGQDKGKKRQQDPEDKGKKRQQDPEDLEPKQRVEESSSDDEAYQENLRLAKNLSYKTHNESSEKIGEPSGTQPQRPENTDIAGPSVTRVLWRPDRPETDGITNLSDEEIPVAEMSDDEGISGVESNTSPATVPPTLNSNFRRLGLTHGPHGPRRDGLHRALDFFSSVDRSHYYSDNRQVKINAILDIIHAKNKAKQYEQEYAATATSKEDEIYLKSFRETLDGWLRAFPNLDRQFNQSMKLEQRKMDEGLGKSRTPSPPETTNTNSIVDQLNVHNSANNPPQLNQGSSPVQSLPQTGGAVNTSDNSSQSSYGEVPSQPTSGAGPSQPTSGAGPSQPTSGAGPSRPTGGAEPLQPTSGEGPSQSSANMGASGTADNRSPIDFVLDKQRTEMPDIADSDGET